MSEKKETTEASVVANCINEINKLESKEEKQRVLKTLATFFELDTPSFRPPKPPFNSGGIRYGTPFP
jgi:hypothetical protein